MKVKQGVPLKSGAPQNNTYMDIRNELELLKARMSEGLTEENAAAVERIKSMATTAEDKKMVEDFVERMLGEVETDVNELERLTIKAQMQDVLEVVNLSYIAKKYFGKTHAWLSQRVNECVVNGKKKTFTEEELKTLNNALQDISRMIGSRRLSY